jgi:dUTPase
MNIKLYKLDERAKLPTAIDNTNTVYELYSTEITTEVGEDAKLILAYHVGYSIHIPLGCVGIITPKYDVAKKSITLTDSATIVTSNNNKPLILKFKVNTDSVPSIFKPGEGFAYLTIVPAIETEYEFVTDESTTENSTTTNMAETVKELNNDITVE